MKIERLINGATQLFDRARTSVREEIGSPEARKEAARRLVRQTVEALAREVTGGPQYDDDGDTLYPPDAVILHDHATDERRARR